MFQEWLEKRRKRIQAERFAKMAGEALGRLGQLMEKYPGSFIDETWLPKSKDAMKGLLMAAIATARTQAHREVYEVGWLSLANFQPNIGDTPISMPVFPARLADVTPEFKKALEQWQEVANRVQAEGERCMAEMRTYVETLG
jgi:hypothetical protein